MQATEPQIDNAIADFTVYGAQPLALDRNDHFKKLITTLQPSKQVMGYPKLMLEVVEKAQKMAEDVRTQVTTASYVCTTADA